MVKVASLVAAIVCALGMSTESNMEAEAATVNDWNKCCCVLHTPGTNDFGYNEFSCGDHKLIKKCENSFFDDMQRSLIQNKLCSRVQNEMAQYRARKKNEKGCCMIVSTGRNYFPMPSKEDCDKRAGTFATRKYHADKSCDELGSYY